MILSGKDLLACKYWNDWAATRGIEDSFAQSLYDITDFAVNYLNCAKIGNSIDANWPIIVTNDPVPMITFERWIRDGFNISRPPAPPCDFDIQKKRFIAKPTSLMQDRINEKKKEQLQNELGRRILEF